jgi:hypothetical protein
MNYHVHTADGRRLDPQTLEEINAAAAAGTLSVAGALVWAPGMSTWEPLSTLLGLPPAIPSASAPATGGDVLGTIIPVKNGKALTAYYCAIFGLIPCVTFILGPTALIMGILGLKAVKRTPGLPGTAHAWVGIILGGLQTLAVVAWFLFVVVMAVSRSR